MSAQILAAAMAVFLVLNSPPVPDNPPPPVPTEVT